jgi:hypothetical protein
MPILSYKFHLYPAKQQGAGLDGMLGAFCDLYNADTQHLRLRLLSQTESALFS